VEYNLSASIGYSCSEIKKEKKKILTSSRIEQAISRNVKTRIPSLFPIKRGR
jgi:hypothetical protein